MPVYGSQAALVRARDKTTLGKTALLPGAAAVLPKCIESTNMPISVGKECAAAVLPGHCSYASSLQGKVLCLRDAFFSYQAYLPGSVISCCQ